MSALIDSNLPLLSPFFLVHDHPSWNVSFHLLCSSVAVWKQLKLSSWNAEAGKNVMCSTEFWVTLWQLKWLNFVTKSCQPNHYTWWIEQVREDKQCLWEDGIELSLFINREVDRYSSADRLIEMMYLFHGIAGAEKWLPVYLLGLLLHSQFDWPVKSVAEKHLLTVERVNTLCRERDLLAGFIHPPPHEQSITFKLTAVPGPNIEAAWWLVAGWTDRDHWTSSILEPGTTVYGRKLVIHQLKRLWSLSTC